MPVTKNNQCDICVAHDGKVGCNTVEHTTALLCCDWLFSMAWCENKNLALSVDSIKIQRQKNYEPRHLTLETISNPNIPF